MAAKQRSVEESVVIENNIVKGPVTPLTHESDLGRAILDALDEEPNHIGIIDADTDEQSTFAEMKDKSIRCALWMSNQGLCGDDFVIVCTHNQLNAYVPFLATIYLESIVCGWHDHVKLEEAKQLMRIYKPRIIFACQCTIDVLMAASESENCNIQFVVFGEHECAPSLEDILKNQSEEDVKNFIPRNLKSPEDVAVVVLSSGSTGLPKGVMFSKESYLRNVRQSVTAKGGKILLFSPIFWSRGGRGTLQYIFNRATRVTTARPEEDTEKLFRMVEKYQIESVGLLSQTVAHLTKSKLIESYNLGSLKEITIAGTPTNSAAMKELENRLKHLTVLQYYSSTELGNASHSQTENRSSYDSIGFPTENTQAKIIHQGTRETLGPNEVGEFCIKRPSLMLGYYKDPELTKQTLDESGWLHTGDLAYYTETGEFFLVARLKDIIRCKGAEIIPLETETLLKSHPAVMEAIVVPVPHESDFQRPMAFVKLFPGENVTEYVLINLSASLGHDKRLWKIEFLNDLPKICSGKIARSDLQQLATNFVGKI